jgi:hypothetical protein
MNANAHRKQPTTSADAVPLRGSVFRCAAIGVVAVGAGSLGTEWFLPPAEWQAAQKEETEERRDGAQELFAGYVAVRHMPRL